MNAESVALTLSDKPKRHNNRGRLEFRVPCPAHGGDGPNLGIWDRDDGSIGVMCFTQGCARKDILKSLGIEPDKVKSRSLYPRPRSKYSKRFLSAMYYTSDGEERPRYRRECGGESCTWPGCSGNSKKHIWGEKGHSPDGVLLKQWAEDGAVKDFVVLVEGEKAAKAVMKAGFRAFSWYGGSSAASLADYFPIKGENVVLWPDDDAAGRKAMSQAAVAALSAGALQIKLVHEEGGESGDDAADFSVDEIRIRINSAKLLSDDVISEHDWMSPEGYSKSDMTPGSHFARFISRCGEHILGVSSEGDDRDLYVRTSTGMWEEDCCVLEEMVGETMKLWREVREEEGATKLPQVDSPKAIADALGMRKRHWNILPNASKRRDIDRNLRYIGSTNGVVDIYEKTVLSQSDGSDKYVTMNTGVKYDPDARERIESYNILKMMTDEEQVWFWKAMGYALLGDPTRAVYILEGAHAAGKSTIMKGILGALGDYGDAVSSATMGTGTRSKGSASPDLEMFGRARIALLPEPKGKLDTEFIKQLSGHSPVSYRPMWGKKQLRLWPRATLVIEVNVGKLANMGTDPALNDRLRVLTIPSIPVEERDKDFHKKVWEPEVQESILSELVYWASELRDSGPPSNIKSVEEALDIIKAENMGEAGEWLKDALVPDDGAWLATDEAWEAACSASGTDPNGDNAFGKSRVSLWRLARDVHAPDFPRRAENHRSSGGKVKKGYRGWRLRNYNDDNLTEDHSVPYVQNEDGTDPYENG